MSLHYITSSKGIAYNMLEAILKSSAMQLYFVTIIVQKCDQIYLKYFKQNQDIKGKIQSEVDNNITPSKSLSVHNFYKAF